MAERTDRQLANDIYDAARELQKAIMAAAKAGLLCQLKMQDLYQVDLPQPVTVIEATISRPLPEE